MGWLFTRNMDGHTVPRSYLDNQFTYARDDRRMTVLASAMVGTTYYAACERLEANGDVQVFAVVCPTEHNPGAPDGRVFGFKDMTEHMGPCESECPAAILDELTDTRSESAMAWRARCRANLRAAIVPRNGANG